MSASSRKQTLHITLKYGPKKAKVINGIRRISKPGLRKYTGVADMPRVRGGLGTAIISTSHGVMTDRDVQSLLGNGVLDIVALDVALLVQNTSDLDELPGVKKASW